MTSTQNLPQNFGNYVLLNAFAKGGMGQVYLAKCSERMHAPAFCVLKKLRQDIELKPEYVRRFIDEARLVIQLSHEKIGHVFDVGCVKNEFFLAMEYISGVNLRKLLHRTFTQDSQLPTAVSLYILREILLALAYAHESKHPVTGQNLHLIHRDVSPQNVMLDFTGKVKLIDFGLAESELKEEQTESQVVMGKIAYMSPEQARGDDVSPKTDQYSAAIVAYELLAGKRFYAGMSNHAIWQGVGQGTYLPAGLQDFSPELNALFRKALQADPEKRFSSCAAFAFAVDTHLQSFFASEGHSEHAAQQMLTLFHREQEVEKKLLARFHDVQPLPVNKNFTDVLGHLDLNGVSLDESRTETASLLQQGSLQEHAIRKSGIKSKVEPEIESENIGSLSLHTDAKTDTDLREEATDLEQGWSGRSGSLKRGLALLLAALFGAFFSYEAVSFWLQP